MKVINDIDIKLNIKVPNIANNKCPDSTLALSLNPKDIALAIYDNNSINTNNGANANGQPAGTNNEKNTNPCLNKPVIVTPNHIITDNDTTNNKCEVIANE